MDDRRPWAAGWTARWTAAAATVLLAGGCIRVEVPTGGTGDADVPAPTQTRTQTADPGGNGGEAQPGQAAPSDEVAALEQRVLELANEARGAEGLGEVAPHEQLADVARAWSRHLAEGGLELAHNPDFSNQIPPGWSQAGENVAWIDEGGRLGTEEVAQQVHQGWMDSPTHRDNLLQEGYTHLGVGVAHHPDHGYYLTQNFATY